MKKALLILSFALTTLPSTAISIRQEDKDRARALVRKMTLEEKILFISGKVDGFRTYPIEHLGIPSMRMADGPQGVRNIDGAFIQSTFYPCGISAAASWNRNAVREMGEGIGSAAKAHGVQIMLGPGVNIYRSALCGRNFEYFGEDPFLASETALAYIRGMQSQGVMATIKHFALNQQEYDRYNTSSNADERTLNEIYFPTFRRAVEEAGVGAVMTSYNPLNGVHTPENHWLVRDNLRNKWGFEGMVVTDWGSTYNTLNYIKGGVDLEMPRADVSNEASIKELLRNGVITEADLDEKCIHILQTFSAFGFLDNPLEADPMAEDPLISQKRAYELALEGPVLLKNDDGILPLKPGRKNLTVVIGPNANSVVCGGGSGWVNPEDGKGITPAEGLMALGKDYPVRLLGSPKPEVLSTASAVVIIVGFDRFSETESKDRKYGIHKMQVDLINTVAKYNSNIIVVVNSGGEVDLAPWGDKAKAILLDWYPGQEGGNALAALLSGKVSPSGRLPFTYWGSLEANPAQKWYGDNQHRYLFTDYGEGIFLGYRGAAHNGVKPLYPFGFGLTYSSFAYSDLNVNPCGDGYDVYFTVTNTGKREAAEVCQVYVAPVCPSIMRPERELKGFDKKKIAPGKSHRVTIHLDRKAFAHYDENLHDWKVDSGTYKIQVGSSAEDILLEKEIDIL